MSQGNKPPWLKPYAMKENPEPLGEQTLTGVTAPRAPAPEVKAANIQAKLTIRKGPALSDINLSPDQLAISLGNSREESEIHLADPMISKRQLVVMRLNREFLVVDCGVNDMVHVNGILTRQACVPVNSRAVISMGNTVMLLSSTEDPPSDVPPPPYLAPRPGAYPDQGSLPEGTVYVDLGGTPAESTGAPILFGSDRQCDVSLRAADIQPIHAMIAFTPEGIVIHNLASGHVLVNKEAVEESALITASDEIMVGGRKLNVRFAGDPVARAKQMYVREEFTFGNFAFTSLNAEALRSFMVPCVGEAHTVGRSPTCDVSLEETSVSRVHAQIIPSGKSFYLIDNYSSNGTFVNDVKISKRRIRAGDVLEFGRNPFIIHYT